MQPQQTQQIQQHQQTPQSQAQAQTPYMQSVVQFYTGVTILSGSLGLLEWSSDGHIRLFSIDPATGQSSGIVFDRLPNQFQKAKSLGSVLELKFDGKTHKMDLSTSAMPWLAAGGAIGLFMANKRQEESGINSWIDNLKSQGVPVSRWSVGVMVLIGLGSGLVLIILLIIVAFIAVLLSPKG